MNTNQRPPIATRKGIAVIQPSKTHKLIDNEEYSSGLRSVRSSSRSRGISISRSTGIKMDKIYEQKHFPLPSQANENNKNSRNLEKTLNSCKSLKLVSVQSEASIRNQKDQEMKLDSNTKQEGEKDIHMMRTGSKIQGKDVRSTSPIGKLNFPSGNSNISKMEGDKQRRLINF